MLQLIGRCFIIALHLLLNNGHELWCNLCRSIGATLATDGLSVPKSHKEFVHTLSCAL